MVTEEQLPYLLKLLDDEEPAIQSALQHEFAETNGDLSHEIAALAIDLPVRDRMKLSHLLLPGRRETLEHEWQVPHGGADALAEDWDTFESLLRLVSDFLHDGVTLRPSLPDMIDMLAMEAADEIENLSANQLRLWMFESGKFIGNRENYYIPQNNDLCWVADTGFGSPISLATLFILVAHRLELEVSGCNYPGHFLARIHIDGKALLVDCFHRGRLIPVHELLSNNKNISQTAKIAILTECHLGHMLSRILRNLEHSFRKDKQMGEALLFRKLHDSLQ
ncbi:Regulator of sirC expression, contains transglutaminase-like and TPR domains [Rubritalea squalenifaciens DSM 18772]|uniref:Regulator of sirC expression, contains transglutaminase-like and TPR domains n=1 Tax=Rubritalea squalenifaciens DSM 18772 TaxID=1123071 RepID=A0A1M6NX78_9BACT|nr:transglutaminase family protein [Rubritalea squalenifaciens]SHK00293.1 Regulator of sirC expression, contains transglutaminase-like and TPR domains [Rubritalea squalenifaciens DSM 18772]